MTNILYQIEYFNKCQTNLLQSFYLCQVGDLYLAVGVIWLSLRRNDFEL